MICLLVCCLTLLSLPAGASVSPRETEYTFLVIGTICSHAGVWHTYQTRQIDASPPAALRFDRPTRNIHSSLLRDARSLTGRTRETGVIDRTYFRVRNPAYIKLPHYFRRTLRLRCAQTKVFHCGLDDMFSCTECGDDRIRHHRTRLSTQTGCRSRACLGLRPHRDAGGQWRITWRLQDSYARDSISGEAQRQTVFSRGRIRKAAQPADGAEKVFRSI